VRKKEWKGLAHEATKGTKVHEEEKRVKGLHIRDKKSDMLALGIKYFRLF
jgi:hypothetical protein